MNLKTIARMRLMSQQIADHRFRSVKDVVGWMGALQAQDYEMAKWAIGLRLPDATTRLVERAVDKGDIIRTHVLRVTWHFVSSDDVYWMLQLSAPHLTASLNGRHRQMGLTEKVFSRSNALLEKALGSGNHRTREELVAVLRKGGIPTDEYRSGHLLGRAEMEGLICSGPARQGKRTYALLRERVRPARPLTREAALARLAMRYFTSHAPATLDDFLWWSGLPAADARSALEMVKHDLVAERVRSQEYWVPGDFRIPPDRSRSVFALPAFDEFIISYRDRSASVPTGHLKKAISNNGIFRPVVVVGGQVAGTWSRTTVRDELRIKVNLFRKAGPSAARKIENAFGAFVSFAGKRAHISA